MSKREWRLFVEDVAESAGFIRQYIEDMTFEAFKDDRKTFDAVVRNLEIIGEASKYIPEGVKETHPDTDWVGIAGLRNRIAHEYFHISAVIVWKIIKEEIPPLEELMREILKVAQDAP